MLSLRNFRRICAAIDAFTVTFIAASLSKSRRKSDISVFATDSNCESFPTIVACKSAILNKRSRTKPQEATEASSSNTCLDPSPIGEPVLFKLKAEKDPEKLFHIFRCNAHDRFVVENRFAFQDTVARLAGARRFDLIEELLEHQKTLPQGRREGFIVRIIMLYGKAGMPDHALKTFHEMELFGCPRTVKSFNATLKVLSQARRFDDANLLFADSSKMYGIGLDVISFNTIIKLMCEMGNLESAYLVMVDMENAGIKPDVVTYTTLISASYKHGRSMVGDGLWNLMVLKGCSPNLATFNVRIQFLINRKRAFQANDLVRLMRKAGIRPDEMTYNLIIKGFCMIGELEMAKQIFYAIHQWTLKPNSKIYQTMIHYLNEAGKFDLAFRLCKNSMERNWFPNVDTIRKLLKGLMSISKDRNAREILKLVKERKTSYSSDEIKEFHDIIRKK